MIFRNFLFCLVSIPITPKILYTSNLRTTSAKSVSRDIMRRLIKYSFLNIVVKAMITLKVFGMLLFEARLM